MVTILFHSTIFGPIRSRRLGWSLGINLSPDDGKICSFDCLYCEAGFNAQGTGKSGFPSPGQVSTQLEKKLVAMTADNTPLDVITFSGNGEPTLHPQFCQIIDDTMALRDRYFPSARVSVLTNATRLDNPDVVKALLRVDNCILKLDSAIETTMRLLDRPNSPAFTLDTLLPQLRSFGQNCIIQTMIVRGTHDGIIIDNTTPDEIDALIAAYKSINPSQVMLYSIDRPTPAQNLVKVERDELETIADRIRQQGINVSVS